MTIENSNYKKNWSIEGKKKEEDHKIACFFELKTSQNERNKAKQKRRRSSWKEKED